MERLQCENRRRLFGFVRPSHLLIGVMVLLLVGLWPQPVLAADAESSDSNDGTLKDNFTVTVHGNIFNESGSTGSNGNTTDDAVPMLPGTSIGRDDNETHSTSKIPGNSSDADAAGTAAHSEDASGVISPINKSNSSESSVSTTPTSTFSTTTTVHTDTAINDTAAPAPNAVTNQSGLPVPTADESLSTSTSSNTPPTSEPPQENLSEFLNILWKLCECENIANMPAGRLAFNITTQELEGEIPIGPLDKINLVSAVGLPERMTFTSDSDLNMFYEITNGSFRFRATFPHLTVGVFKTSWSLKVQPIIHLKDMFPGFGDFCKAVNFPERPSSTTSSSVSSTSIPEMAPIANPFRRRALYALAFLFGFTFAVFFFIWLIVSCGKCSDSSVANATANWTTWNGIATNFAIYKSNARAWISDVRSGRRRSSAARYSTHRDAETGLLESNYELL